VNRWNPGDVRSEKDVGPSSLRCYGRRRRTHQTQAALRTRARATKIAAAAHCSGQ